MHGMAWHVDYEASSWFTQIVYVMGMGEVNVSQQLFHKNGERTYHDEVCVCVVCVCVLRACVCVHVCVPMCMHSNCVCNGVGKQI